MGEVKVKGALGDSGCPGDLLHRRRFDTVIETSFGPQPYGGPHQSPARLLGTILGQCGTPWPVRGRCLLLRHRGMGAPCVWVSRQGTRAAERYSGPGGPRRFDRFTLSCRSAADQHSSTSRWSGRGAGTGVHYAHPLMRIGVFFPSVEHVELDAMATRVGDLVAAGFDSAWLPQSSASTPSPRLAVIGHQVAGITLGTAVIPTYPRHPVALAAQALTANAAVGGRLALGIGLSHKMAIEGRFGLSYDRPARHMREYLSILLPLIESGRSEYRGETLVGLAELSIPGSQPLPVYLAALQPAMLGLAGSMADGTITWCTGPITVEQQIVPLISKAASEAGRPAPAWSWLYRAVSPTMIRTVGRRRMPSSRDTVRSPSIGPFSIARGRRRRVTCPSSAARRP